MNEETKDIDALNKINQPAADDEPDTGADPVEEGLADDMLSALEDEELVDIDWLCLEGSDDIEHLVFYRMELVNDIARLDNLCYSLNITYDDLDDMVEEAVRKLEQNRK